ncbi:MAG: hypothetical protein C0596_07575 [Marinilabiliales bacterium]|nr:MAG: hypothetical protein C0596_07575 [Marinilabiliales bacterium]
MKRILSIFIFISIISTIVKAQVNVPLTSSDLMDIQRERDIMKMMNIDVSQTWLYLVKDNMVSSNKYLVSEIIYNESGSPEKMVFFDEDMHVKSFTKVKYNKKNLPFEEIRFTSDSSLLNGIMYIYDKDDLLEKQINYNNSGDIISTYKYSRLNDTVFIDEFNGLDDLVSKSFLIIDSGERTDYIKKIVKINTSDNTVEKQIFEYDDMSLLTKKTIIEGESNTGYKTFVYNDDGALVKSSFYTENNEFVNSTSYEYDDYGNVIRIIERQEKDNSTKVFVINYLTKTQNED